MSTQNTQPILRDDEWVKSYERSLTYDQWCDWKHLQQNEREFAKNCNYDGSYNTGYGPYWETLTIQELREAQS